MRDPREVNTMLIQRWAIDPDSGTSLNQQWAKVYRLRGRRSRSFALF